jgi:hypothetical protein
MKTFAIPRSNLSKCFGCSLNNPHGLQLQFWLSEEGCYTRCSIPSHFCGFDGLVHGGIIGMLLDEVAAWANFVHFFRIGMTVEASIRYLKPVPTETELLLESKIISHSEKSSVIHSSISSKAGILLAEGSSKWLLPDYPLLAKVTGIAEGTLQTMVKEMMDPIEELMVKAKAYWTRKNAEE